MWRSFCFDLQCEKSQMAATLDSDSDDSDFENHWVVDDSDSWSDIFFINIEYRRPLTFLSWKMKMMVVKWVGDAILLQWMWLHPICKRVPRVHFQKMAQQKPFPFLWQWVLEKNLLETNRYARQSIGRKLSAFFGLHVLFGIHVLPETSLYWSNDSTLGTPYVKLGMTRDRFYKLNPYHADFDIRWQSLKLTIFGTITLYTTMLPLTNNKIITFRQI